MDVGENDCRMMEGSSCRLTTLSPRHTAYLSNPTSTSSSLTTLEDMDDPAVRARLKNLPTPSESAADNLTKKLPTAADIDEDQNLNMPRRTTSTGTKSRAEVGASGGSARTIASESSVSRSAGAQTTSADSSETGSGHTTEEDLGPRDSPEVFDLDVLARKNETVFLPAPEWAEEAVLSAEKLSLSGVQLEVFDNLEVELGERAVKVQQMGVSFLQKLDRDKTMAKVKRKKQLLEVFFARATS